MSVPQNTSESQTKKFGQGERVIPTAADKASKYYPVGNSKPLKQVCFFFSFSLPERFAIFFNFSTTSRDRFFERVAKTGRYYDFD